MTEAANLPAPAGPAARKQAGQPPARPPVAFGALTKEEFDAELEKGVEDFRAGRYCTIEEVEARLRSRYGISF